MAQQTWQLEFNPWIPQGGRREPTSESCSVKEHTHIHTHTNTPPHTLLMMLILVIFDVVKVSSTILTQGNP